MSDVYVLSKTLLSSLENGLFNDKIKEVKVVFEGTDLDVVYDSFTCGEMSVKDKPFFTKGEKVRYRECEFGWSYGLVYSVENEVIECISIGEGVCTSPQVVELFQWNEEFLIKEVTK